MALLLQMTQKLSQGFPVFWDRYPRREARKDAVKAWGQVVKDDPAIEEQIHAALDWQIPMWADRERQYIPLPASYLRGERFTDEPPPKAKPPLTDEQKRVLARIQSNLPQRGPVNAEIRARLAEEWGRE